MMDVLVAHGPTVVTVVFFAIFLGIGLWAYAPRNKRQMTDHGNIPFKE